MAELTQRERLQPALLDRLTDFEPQNREESREHRVLSLRVLREAVLRDLRWLLNTTNLFSVIDSPRLPHIRNSVLNYGIPDLSGLSVTSLDTSQIERGIRQAIWDFEPRLIRASVVVKALADGNKTSNKLTFEIEADLWAQPYPERLYLKTELDLESATVSLAENVARSTL
ncbi:MAG: type VI secretion system baseplate subunit TssE [Yersinia sp. (in: enterobacteria)]